MWLLHARLTPCGCARSVAHRRTKLRRGLSAVGWLAPITALVLMPKCPACVVAYIALLTGVGVSISAAAHLRFGLIALCAVTLACLFARSLYRRWTTTLTPEVKP